MPQPNIIPDDEMDHLESASPKGFIPDDEMDQIDARSVPPKRESKSPLESAISGTADMLTFGHSDELAAGLRAGAVSPFVKDKTGDLYDRYLNEQREHKQQSEEDNPGYYLAGNIAGGIIPALATGGAALTEEAPALARGARAFYSAVMPKAGASTLSNIGRGALGGALLGSGNSNARPTDSPDALENYAGDVLQGSALGAATAGIADKASKVIGGLSPTALRRAAGDRAVKAATGQNRAAITAMRRAGVASEEGNSLESAGRIIQRADEAGPAVVQAGDRAENILPKAVAKQKFYGQKIGDVSTVIDRTMPKSIDGKRIAGRIIDYASTLPETEETSHIINRLQREALRMENRDAMSFGEAQALKKAFKFSPTDPTKQKFGQEASNELNKIMRTEMNDAASTLAKTTNDPHLKKTLSSYLDYKDKYQAYKNIANATQKRVDANLSNRFVSPSDYGTAGMTLMASAAHGVGPLKTAAMALAAGTANKVLRERGSSVASAGFRNLASVLERSPQILGKFGTLIESAAKRGPAAMVITHQMLLKDPEYRKLIQPEMSEEP